MRQSMQLIHFMMYNIKNKAIELVKTKGQELSADNFTKPASTKRFWKHISTIMGEHADIEDARRRAGQKREDKEATEEERTEGNRDTRRRNIVNTISINWERRQR